MMPALGWVAEQRVVQLDVLAHVLDPADPFTTARTRAVVRGWHRHGLVECRRLLVGASPVVWPTAVGLRASALRSRATPPPLGLLAHLHAVCLVRLGVERLGGVWTSEPRLTRARPSADAHVADAVFRTAGGAEAAVEVELTPKGAARLRLILDELTLDHERVVYVVRGSRVRAAVERAVEALACHRQVSVVDLACFGLPLARSRARGRAALV
jgi:hypothetical protein